MKRTVLSLAALLLAGAATSAMAQEHHGGGGWRGGGGSGPGGWHGDGGQNQGAGAPQGQPAPAPAPQPAPAQGGGRHWGGDGGQHWQGRGGNGDGGQPWQDRGGRGDDAPSPAQPPAAADRHQGGGDHRWSRGDGDRGDWNRGDDRRGWSGRGGEQWRPHRYPPTYRSDHRFRGPAWRAPRGYYARAWRYGEILPFGWYSESYWIDGWWDYGLMDPPPGYHWVRVGDDALLVDDYNGEIVQVVRDLFW